MKTIKFIIFIIVISIIFPSGEALAQGEVRTMTVVPPAVQQTLNPGDKEEGFMKIINDSTEMITFTVAIRDFIVVDTHGTPNFLPPNTLNQKYSAGSWIAVFPTTFTLEPKQKQDLQYFIQIPADAKPGGHYAGSVYTAVNTDVPEGTGTAVETQLGTLFSISVNGPITESSNISKFIANPFQEYGPVKVTTTIKNMGDLHIAPEAKVKITDMLGREMESQALTPFNVFPGAEREYENTFGQQLMIGRFKADLVGTYGKNNNLPLLATVYFWVFPWKITLVIILVLIALFLAWKLSKKRGSKIHADHERINADSSTPTS